MWRPNRLRAGLLGLPAGAALALAASAVFSGTQMVDATASWKLDFTHRNSPTASKYLPEAMGGGVAIFDFDNDGRLDVFFTNGAALREQMPAGTRPVKTAPEYWNRLFHQKPDGTFTDVTGRAGLSQAATGLYTMGAATGDYDNDGFTDLFVTAFDRATLYHNNGDGTFSDVTARAGTDAPGWSTSAAFLDFDRDGYLDLVVARYAVWSFDRNPVCGGPSIRAYCHPKLFPGASVVLYRNQRNGTFADVTRRAGLENTGGKGLGVAVADIDNDGWPDLYIANDSVQAFLYRNQGDGTFRDLSLAAGVGYSEDGVAPAGMGTDFADLDNDGYPDLVVTDLSNERYLLFVNRRDLTFRDATAISGVGKASLLFSGWGVKFADLNNDGWKDLFVAQGHVMDTIETENPHLRYLQPALILANLQGKFEPAAAAPRTPWAGRGAATGDLDNDGDLDVVVANCGQKAYALRNDGGNRKSWLGLTLEGTVSNRDAIGARVKLTAAGRTQYYSVSTSGSYLSASDKRIVAGLDQAVAADVEITWPSGRVQRVNQLAARKWHRIEEPRTPQ
ncbi:MAG: CRTAC1 family protein [Acidobacteria bacterium]|nr:CRTAC1 family protein [Acidobacteriota bacterium]